MSRRPPPGAPNATRGLVIVVAAGLLGLVLLARGGSTSLLASGSSATNSQPTTTVVNVPTIPKTATTVPQATNPPADVKVAVFNGTGGKDENAAGNNQRKLTPLGYTQVTIADTTATPTSAVYYADGSQGDAVAIASALGLPTTAVAPMSSAKSLPPGTQGVNVVVIIGEDSATGQ
jgi:hypothetical protein